MKIPGLFQEDRQAHSQHSSTPQTAACGMLAALASPCSSQHLNISLKQQHPPPPLSVGEKREDFDRWMDRLGT